ncbi:hypothetical protein YBT020_13055 [Bacillus thuringiensis serovar finitimus YBT-020]|nr:hypothetical protein YBT020_13055 [Bacillus thuringiensis serovar finitimus YBT-020]
MILTALGVYLMLGSFYSYWCRNKGLDQSEQPPVK